MSVDHSPFFIASSIFQHGMKKNASITYSTNLLIIGLLFTASGIQTADRLHHDSLRCELTKNNSAVISFTVF